MQSFVECNFIKKMRKEIKFDKTTNKQNNMAEAASVYTKKTKMFCLSNNSVANEQFNIVVYPRTDRTLKAWEHSVGDINSVAPI